MLLVTFSLSDLSASEDECARTAQMQIYTNAFLHEETGDVLGYELAIEQRNGSTAHALLYVYEGAPNDEGMEISGPITDKKVRLQGTWDEHLTESPSEKEIVKTHFVRVNGTLDSISFRGTVNIDGMDTPEKVRLKRVDRLWLCKR
jgi:hypothetical protein